MSASLQTGAVVAEDFAQYAITFTFTGGGENFNNVIPIQSDAHFYCTTTMFDSTLLAAYATAILINGGSLIQLIDGSTQKALQNIQVPINCLFGTAREPHVWSKGHLFKANAPIGINITGTGAAGQVVRLVFEGLKIPV